MRNLLKLERRSTDPRILGRLLTVVCVSVVVAMFVIPLIKRGLDHSYGNAPLSEIEVGSEPGRISFVPKAD